MAIDLLDRLLSTLYSYSVPSSVIRRTLWLASPFARCRYSPLHNAASAATVEFRRKIKIRATNGWLAISFLCVTMTSRLIRL